MPLVGDAKETLRELLPLLERKEDRSWREQIEEQVAEWWRVVEDLAHDGRRPDEPAARDLGAVDAAAGGRDPRRRLRLVDELVRARTCKLKRGNAGVALGDARDDGAGRAVRDRGEVRVSRTGR